MKNAIAVAMITSLAACGGEEPKVAPTAANTNAKAIAAPAEPTKPNADKELEQRVSRALQGAKLYNVDVVATGGAVTLWGSAPSAKERGLAARVAGKVEGVKAVENKLDIVSGS
jgi:osmotically-inducible protein OsmY